MLFCCISAPSLVPGPQAPNEKCLADELQEALIKSVHQTDSDDDVFLPDSKPVPKVYPKFSCKFLEELVQVKFNSVSKNTRAYLNSDNLYLKEDSSHPTVRKREPPTSLDPTARKRESSTSSDLTAWKREPSTSSDLTAWDSESSITSDVTARKREPSTSSDVTARKSEPSTSSDLTARKREPSTSSDVTPKKQELSVASGGGRKDDEGEGKIL